MMEEKVEAAWLSLRKKLLVKRLTLAQRRFALLDGDNECELQRAPAGTLRAREKCIADIYREVERLERDRRHLHVAWLISRRIESLSDEQLVDFSWEDFNDWKLFVKPLALAQSRSCLQDGFLRLPDDDGDAERLLRPGTLCVRENHIAEMYREIEDLQRDERHMHIAWLISRRVEFTPDELIDFTWEELADWSACLDWWREHLLPEMLAEIEPRNNDGALEILFATDAYIRRMSRRITFEMYTRNGTGNEHRRCGCGTR